MDKQRTQVPDQIVGTIRRAGGKSRRDSTRFEPLEARVMLSAATKTIVSDVWAGHNVQVVQGEYIAIDKNGVDFGALAAKYKLPVTGVSSLGGDGYFSFHTDAPVPTVAKWAKKLSSKASITPDFVTKIADTTPNDPLFTDQWHLQNTGQLVPDDTVANGSLTFPSQVGTPGVDANLARAWDLTTGSSNNVVAVLDSGIDLNQPDLQANIYTNPGEVGIAADGSDKNFNGVDDDGNGLIDDAHGWNFFDNNNDVSDQNGHGTHVSGIIGAIGNNATGVSGVNWNVKILPIKIGDASGMVTFDAAISGIEYCDRLKASGEANIVAMNASFGGTDFPFNTLFANALHRAAEQNIFFVAAAGNDSANVDTGFSFPAKFSLDNPNVITVAATDNQDNLASFSNLGAASVDIAAPGVNILSTTPTYPVTLTMPGVDQFGFPTGPETTENYGYLSGTSQATPVVTGIIALERALRPDATMAQIKKALFDGADQVPGLQGVVKTGGRVNAFHTLLDLQSEFAQTDSVTQGNWQGAYGSQGAGVVGTAQSLPAGVTVASDTTTTVPIAAGAKLKAGALEDGNGGQIVSYLSDPNTINLDVNFGDNLTHRVSVYAVDYDNKKRSEQIKVLDFATGTVLDIRNISGFRTGQYITYDLTGHAQIQITNTAGPKTTAVVSGVFVDPSPTLPDTLVKTDATTAGQWRNQYGSQGAFVVGDSASFPAFAQVGITGATTRVVKANVSTKNTRAFQKDSSVASNTVGYLSTSGSALIDINLTDGQAHQITFGAVDFDKKKRAERIDEINADTGALLSSQSLSGFVNPQYVTFQATGHVQFRLTRLAGPDAVISGIFFDSVPGSLATYDGMDSTTQGSWETLYGQNGQYIPGDSGAFPDIITGTLDNSFTNVLSYHTSLASAVRKPSDPAFGDRIESYFGTATTMTLDMTFNDSDAHRTAFYVADFENARRVERIDIIDPTTGNTISSQTVSAFKGGKYVTWDLRGHVQVKITRLVGPSAVLSGVFVA